MSHQVRHFLTYWLLNVSHATPSRKYSYLLVTRKSRVFCWDPILGIYIDVSSIAHDPSISVEKLETLPAGTKSRTPRTPSITWRREAWKEEALDNLPWEGHRQSDEHWNRLKDDVGETSQKRGGAHMSFSKRIDTISNWSELRTQSWQMFSL